MNFDFDKFAKNIYQDFEKDLSYSQVEDLLDVKTHYDVDNPISTGKKLVLNRISFYGEKKADDLSDYSGDKISYSEELKTGVNIWIADNLKGKSSIFKIITFALTGNQKLKNNFKDWISDIILNLTIGEKKYTIYLNCEDRLSAKLIIGSIIDLKEIEEENYQTQFESKSRKDFQNRIQDFFFNQFAYYSLKWTQKASQKNKNELQEANTSWKTYFKSIFLESKDSNSLMYGSQGEKVFQMLLGLKFTLPINRLSVKKDNLEFEKAKKVDTNEDEKSNQRKELEKKLSELHGKIQDLESNQDNSKKISEQYKKYNSLIIDLENRNQKALEFENQILNIQESLELTTDKKYKYIKEYKAVNKEIDKTKKRVNDLNEYLEIDAFFSNIEIKKCPSCDSNVEHNGHNHTEGKVTCSLCHEEYDKDERNFDQALFEQKIETLKNDRARLEDKSVEINEEIEKTKGSEKHLRNKLTTLNAKKSKLPETSKIQEKLSQIEKNILEQKAIKDNQDSRDDLVSERAVVKHKLTELEDVNGSQSQIDVKISLLSQAIEELSRIRIQNGKDILDRLKELMLDEIHEFGLDSITEIEINENFIVKYKQDGEFVSFNDIVEGEQLRAKIAFYLSLIQLDIENNFGRHTRFLIIDSPGKEEGDENYLEGFAKIMRSIEDRFKNDLQILIGTAERKLEHVVENEKITPKGEFIF